MNEKQQLVEDLVEVRRWLTPTQAQCRCPLGHEALLYLDGVPTLNCFHQKCKAQVQELNTELREQFEELRASDPDSHPAPVVIDEAYVRRLQKLRAISVNAQRYMLPMILGSPVQREEWLERSPAQLGDDTRDDWRHIMSLFKPSDVVWCGCPTDSGSEEHQRNFRTSANWLQMERCPGPLVCAATFLDGSYQRTAKRVRDWEFLIVESDHLDYAQQGALIQHLARTLKLVAIVCTGGKSLHAWFIVPKWNFEKIEEFKALLEGLGCDTGPLRLPCMTRLPGWLREEKNRWQQLLYYDPASVTAHRAARETARLESLARSAQRGELLNRILNLRH